MLQSVVLKLALILPRLDTVSSMRLTHCPERLMETGVFRPMSEITNVSQCVRVDTMSLVSFRVSSLPFCDVAKQTCHWDRHDFHVHMFAPSQKRNTAVVCENNNICALVVLQTRPYGTFNTLLHVRCHVHPRFRKIAQEVLNRYERSVPTVTQSHAAQTNDLLTRWRFFAGGKREFY